MIQAVRRRFAFLSILRYRDYRIYYVGLLFSVTSHQGLLAAQGWLVFDMTGEPAALGYVAAAQAVPAIALNLFAGALADRMDPRKMILIGESAAAVVTGALAVIVITGGVEVWHIVVASFLAGIGLSFDQPSRRVVWPALIPRDQYVSGTALNQGVWHGTRVIAPAIATGIIAIVDSTTGDARLGAGIALLVISGGFLAMALAIMAVKLPPMKRATGATVLHDIKDGLQFVVQHRIFLMLLGLSFAVGYFGLSYQWLLPALAKEVLGRGPQGLGMLMSASGVGGVIGLFVIASFGRNHQSPWQLGGGAAAFGVAIIGLGFAGEAGMFEVALLLAAFAGALYGFFQIAANTMMNLLVPTEYRGRVMGLRGIMWSLSPLGALQAGLIASFVSTPFAIALGGVAILVVFGLAFALSSELRNVRALVAEADAAATNVERELATGG